MQIDLITKKDLEAFNQELIAEIIEIIKPEPRKKWLTSSDVMEILSCSSSTLQNLRMMDIVKFTKIGGKLYYEATHIDALFEKKEGE